MELTEVQALQNLILAVKTVRFTLEEAEAIKQSIAILSQLVSNSEAAKKPVKEKAQKD